MYSILIIAMQKFNLFDSICFQLAGYPLPFITIGLIIFTSVNLICVIMPRSFTVRDTAGRATEGLAIYKILHIRGVLFSAAGTLAAACTAGFINATLEPHLRQVCANIKALAQNKLSPVYKAVLSLQFQFALSPFQTGVVYAIFGLVYAISAPGFGWLCDNVREPKYITLLGGISNLIAFLLMGPAPMFSFDTYVD